MRAAGLPPPPDEFLAATAPLAWRLSRSLCRHTNDDGITCAPFHGIWQALRRLELITTPWDQGAFFFAAFRSLARQGLRRVLVSGAADCAMPAVVHWAFAAAGVEPEITVLDVCETPLALCARFAARHGLDWTLVAADIADYRPSRTYDVVCTHSFLGNFPPPGRRALLERWRDLLVAGGGLVSVNRLRPGAPERVGFGADQAAAFRARVMAAADQGEPLGIPAADLAQLAEDYIRHRVVHPLGSEGELRRLVEDAGFLIEALTVAPVAGRAAAAAGPTLPGGADYACFVARRG